MNIRAYAIVAALAFALGFGANALWHRPSSPQSQVSELAWCDSAHAVPFIDAQHCGGLSSCDRAYFINAARRPLPDFQSFCAQWK